MKVIQHSIVVNPNNSSYETILRAVLIDSYLCTKWQGTCEISEVNTPLYLSIKHTLKMPTTLDSQVIIGINFHLYDSSL